MDNPKPQRKYSSPYSFDTQSELLTQGIVHADDLAAIAGLRMQQEEDFEESERLFEEWLEAQDFPPALETEEEEF
ncbi:hypothetical protein CAL7716_082460 [Calothrix sp. PCC 7716]|nr:hypothetical protein CAL7716_082460 [Calothrix sp. PCC 7716]